MTYWLYNEYKNLKTYKYILMNLYLYIFQVSFKSMGTFVKLEALYVYTYTSIYIV